MTSEERGRRKEGDRREKREGAEKGEKKRRRVRGREGKGKIVSRGRRGKEGKSRKRREVRRWGGDNKVNRPSVKPQLSWDSPWNSKVLLD